MDGELEKRAVMDNSCQMEKGEIVQIARRQSALLYCVLARILIVLVGGVLGALWPVASLAVAVCTVVCLVRLRMAMKKSLLLTVILAILLFVPLIGLIILVVNTVAATKILRGAGLKVGLMGVSASELANFINR